MRMTAPIPAGPAVAHVDGWLYRQRVWALIVALLACTAWSYWYTCAELQEFWRLNDDYSVGMLVAPVAAYLIWRQRQALARLPWRPSWWGVALIAAAQILRAGGVYYAYASAERLSLAVSGAGLILLIGGWPVFRRLVWVAAFLLLMVPLPARIHSAVSPPLQALATRLGVFGLELVGLYVRRDGNVLHVEDHTTVMVAEACSGLRMLSAFVFVAAVLCFLIHRPLWQRVVILLSSIPVAILSNGLRVWSASLYLHYSQNYDAERMFHDLAGVLMMPLALAFLFAELWVLRLLTAASETSARAPAGRRPQARSRGEEL